MCLYGHVFVLSAAAVRAANALWQRDTGQRGLRDRLSIMTELRTQDPHQQPRTQSAPPPRPPRRYMDVTSLPVHPQSDTIKQWIGGGTLRVRQTAICSHVFVGEWGGMWVGVQTP